MSTLLSTSDGSDDGIDFILKGIDELFDDNLELRGTDVYTTGIATDISAHAYKYGVLHLFSGFLLLLKEKLARHLPALIYTGLCWLGRSSARSETPRPPHRGRPITARGGPVSRGSVHGSAPSCQPRMS